MSLDTPRDFVQSGWDYQRDLGNTWREYVISALDNFQYVVPQAISFEVPPDLTIDYGSFVRPVAPERPTFADVSVTLPVAPTLDDITIPDLAAVPVEPTFDTTYVKPTAPNAAMPVRPEDDDVVLLDIAIPDAPTIALPDEPTLYAIDLPALPDLTVPTFDGVRPVRDFTVPAQQFAWQAVAYDETTINAIKSRLSDMQVNGLGLPAAVEAALFDRQRGREDVISLAAIQYAASDLAARGLRQPAGLMTRRLDRIGAENRQRTSSANRDLTIRMAEMNVESVRFALSQAVTLESTLVQINVQNNELALKGASAAQQFLNDVFNMQVTLHNAEWDGFKTDAAVFESRIRALDSQVSLYKSQIDGQKVIGDLNESLVRSYGETVRSRDTLIAIYRAQIEAGVAKGTLNTQKLEQARLRLQTFSEDVNAWAKQQDGYRISVDAELGNLRAQEVLANVFGQRINAMKTINESYFAQGEFQIKKQIQQLELFRAKLQGAQIDSQTQVAALDAKVRVYAADGSIFGVQGQVSAAESAAHDRTAELRLGAARLTAETQQKSLEMTANYAIKVIDEQIEVLKAKAQVVAQLAASSQSGVNFGASYSGSIGISAGYSTSFGYSGDTDDANPPTFLIPGF
jgi:hypothetical protein